MGLNLKPSLLKRSSLRRVAGLIFRLLTPLFDPIKAVQALPGYVSFFRDLRRYSRLAEGEVNWFDLQPQLGEAGSSHPVDAYFYLGIWATQRIQESKVCWHVDVASNLEFVGLLSTFTRVTFLDYRPLPIKCNNLDSIAGDIVALPFADNSVPSLSCLHVAEHIGLGRYGDPLDPSGTYKACRELARVLSVGGTLYFAVPIGISRTCFNAHRIHSPYQIIDYFADLTLIEFSGTDDAGTYLENAEIGPFSQMRHACGFFRFRKG
jgi:hypothetical protein